MRVVFDTNVIVSALMLLGSPPRRAFDAARQRGRLLVSEATLEELDDVLRRSKLAGYGSEDNWHLFSSVYRASIERATGPPQLRRDLKPHAFHNR